MDRPDYPPAPPAAATDSDEDVGLGEVLAAIRRRRWVLAAVVVPAMLAATLASFLLTPRYTGETLVVIEPQQQNFVSFESVVAGLPGDLEAVESEAFVLRSRSLADRVIQRLGLDADPEFNDTLADRPARAEDAGALTAREYSAVVDAFLDRLAVSPQESSRVIAVRFSSQSPEKAAEIANVVADEYILSRLESKFETTQRASAWLNERVADLREQVARAESAVEQARRAAGIVESQGFTLTSRELAELNSQLIMARTERAEAEARLQSARRLARTPGGVSTTSDVLNSPLIQRLREQQAEVERRVAELSSELGDRHPRMVQLRAEAKDIEARIESEVDKIVAGLRNRVSVAQAREDSLQESLDALKDRAADTSEDEIRLRALEREAEASRTLLATMLARQKETVSQDDLDFQQADARIISRADVPVDPSFPQKPVILGLTLVGALLVGMLLILVVELLDRGFRSGEQMEQQLGVASLGFVPLVKRPDEYQSLAGYVAGRPTSAFGESIRTLNWSLRLAFADAPPRTVVITSALPGEGKTTTASCLATLQSLAGQRVLLIDADTRRPGCDRLTGTERRPGLVDVLVGDASVDDALRHSELSGMTVLNAGSPTPNAPNLLASDRMRALLDELRGRFDLVVIDSPPVMAAADARILAALADATVLAVRWGQTRRDTVRLAIRQLRGTEARLAGALLTAVDTRKNAEYAYGDSGAYTGELEKYYAG